MLFLTGYCRASNESSLIRDSEITSVTLHTRWISLGNSSSLSVWRDNLGVAADRRNNWCHFSDLMGEGGDQEQVDFEVCSNEKKIHKT